MTRLVEADRIDCRRQVDLRYVALSSTTFRDQQSTISGLILASASSRGQEVYVVQTSRKVVERCILMATDPGDLVLDPDLRFRHHRLRRRAMGPPLDHDRHLARRAGAGPCPHHGRALSVTTCWPTPATASKEAEVTRTAPSSQPVHGNIRHGFVYERVPHITLKSIANNAEIDVIWEKWQATLEPLREQLNAALKKTWQEWEIPARGRGQVAGRGEEAARRLVAGAHRPAEGDRRLHRRQGRVRVPLRQALRGQEEGPRRRPVHGREPQAPPRAGRGRERRTDRHARRRTAPNTEPSSRSRR